MTGLDAIVVTSPHCDHLDIPSIRRARAASPRCPLLASAMLPSHSRRALAVAAEDAIAVPRTSFAQLGGFKIGFSPAEYSGHPWERGAHHLVVSAEGESVLFVSDGGPPTRDGIQALWEQLGKPRLSAVLLADNSYIRGGRRAGLFKNENGRGAPSMLDCVSGQCEMGLRHLPNEPSLVVLAGSGFAAADHHGIARFDAWNVGALAQLETRWPLRHSAPGDGFAIEAGLASDLGPGVTSSPLALAVPQEDSDVPDGTERRLLDALRVPFLLSGLGRGAVFCNQIGERRFGPVRLAIRLTSAYHATRCFGLDLARAEFVPLPSLPAGCDTEAYPFGLEIPISWLLAILKGELGVWDASISDRTRQWFVGSHSPLSVLAALMSASVSPQGLRGLR